MSLARSAGCALMPACVERPAELSEQDALDLILSNQIGLFREA